MTAVPIYQAQADLFRTLGHPLRIRVLELLTREAMPVRDLLRELDVEASNLSQQLAVLRRTGLVTSSRQGSTVVYDLAAPAVADLLVVGRTVLTAVLSDTEAQLAELRGEA